MSEGATSEGTTGEQTEDDGEHGGERAEVTFSDEEKEVLGNGEWAIVVATFYPDLANRLVAGAIEGFADGGVSPASVHTYEVMGAFELPFIAKACAQSARFAGIACLGVVIRGETDHYDFVCGEAAAGIQNTQLETGVPCAFGVITCETREQAEARAGGGKRDQGRHAAQAIMGSHLLAMHIASGG
jgi:6,7-dimethyl-8-ribityllumazine synthase